VGGGGDDVGIKGRRPVYVTLTHLSNIRRKEALEEMGGGDNGAIERKRKWRKMKSAQPHAVYCQEETRVEV
jgi:hypothetical protein